MHGGFFIFCIFVRFVPYTKNEERGEFLKKVFDHACVASTISPKFFNANNDTI